MDFNAYRSWCERDICRPNSSGREKQVAAPAELQPDIRLAPKLFNLLLSGFIFINLRGSRCDKTPNSFRTCG